MVSCIRKCRGEAYNINICASKQNSNKQKAPNLVQVALLFLLGDATSPNWPTWAAFFEMAAKLQLNPEAAVRAGEVLREVTKVSVQDATGSSRLLHPPLQPYPHLDNYTFHRLQQGLPVAPESMQLLLPKRRKLHNSSTSAASLGGKHFPCLEELAMQQQQTHQDINMRSSQSPDAETRAFSNLHDHTLSDPQSRASSACVHPMIQKQHLFSVYVHTPPGLLLPQGSLFSGCELDKRSNTANAYAQYPLMDAALLLLQAALANKANTKFVLVGEASIPLYPPQVGDFAACCCGDFVFTDLDLHCDVPRMGQSVTCSLYVPYRQQCEGWQCQMVQSLQ